MVKNKQTNKKTNKKTHTHLPRPKTWFDPRVGKIHWRRKLQPKPVYLPGKSHGQRSLVGYSPWGHREPDMTYQLNSKSNVHTIQKWVSSRTVIPNLFGTRDQFCGRQFFHGPGRGGWFQDELSTLHVLYTFFLLLLHQLHLRSSGIRSQRLGTPALGHTPSYLRAGILFFS